MAQTKSRKKGRGGSIEEHKPKTPPAKPQSLEGKAKERRIEDQAAREEANRERRAKGEPTPWELARAARQERRKPLRGEYARRMKQRASELKNTTKKEVSA